MKKLLIIFLLVFSSVALFAQQSFDAEKLLQPGNVPGKMVNDYTNTLSPSEIQALEQKLVNLDRTTSTQIAVAIVPTLNGKDVADFGTEILRAWGVGGKKNNNGVVLLIAKADRKLNIAVGYGLEGSLPDITAGRIIQNVIVPNFKANNYYKGIDEGTDAIIEAVKGTYNEPAPVSKGRGISLMEILIIALVIIFIIRIISRGNRGNGTFVSRRGSRGFDGPIFFPTGGSNWGGGHSGGGWSSGGGGFGGGFGGFGGGSGGGGGASGSW